VALLARLMELHMANESHENKYKAAKIVRCPRCGLQLNDDGLAISKNAKPSEEVTQASELMVYEGGACQHIFVKS
jgi:hypothetical protein